MTFETIAASEIKYFPIILQTKKQYANILCLNTLF